VDTGVFKAHSTRAASVSKAHASGVSVSDVISAGGWSSDNCFCRYYLKEIQSDFQTAVLNAE